MTKDAIFSAEYQPHRDKYVAYKSEDKRIDIGSAGTTIKHSTESKPTGETVIVDEVMYGTSRPWRTIKRAIIKP